MTTITTSADGDGDRGVDLNARNLTVDTNAAAARRNGDQLKPDHRTAGAWTLTGGTLGDGRSRATGTAPALGSPSLTGNDISLGNIERAGGGGEWRGQTSVTAADGAGPDAGSITTRPPNQTTARPERRRGDQCRASGRACGGGLTTITTSADTVNGDRGGGSERADLTVEQTNAGSSAAGRPQRLDPDHQQRRAP
ncbi:MAG: hypothetical protein IPP68_12455 [Elusimicrobia bacterium]|nr:hypothetical protein [Elusimicrobiota bacterium]